MIGHAVQPRRPADHLDPVDAGQTEVEDDDVGVVARGERRAPPRPSPPGRPRSRAPCRFVPSARRICGSSSTTRIRVISLPSAGRPSSARPRACPRSRPRRPWPRRSPCATASPSPTPSPLPAGRRAAGTGRKIRSRSAGGTPGPRSTTRTSTRLAATPGDDPHGRAVRGCGRAALAITLASARSSSPGSASTRGCVSATSTSTSAARGPMLASAAGITSSTPTGVRLTSSAPVWSRLMSRRLPTSALSRSVSSSIVVEELARLLGRPVARPPGAGSSPTP